MKFKGIVSIGSTVEARFSSDIGNSGSATLFIGSTSESEKAQTAMVAAGGSASLQLQVNRAGMLRVYVTMPGAGDSGRLDVQVSGGQHDSETVTVDTTWTYSVE